jgi:hypothetical protein
LGRGDRRRENNKEKTTKRKQQREKKNEKIKPPSLGSKSPFPRGI